MATISIHCWITLINGPFNILCVLYPVLCPYMPYHLADAINRVFKIPASYWADLLAISQANLFDTKQFCPSVVCPEVPILVDCTVCKGGFQ